MSAFAQESSVDVRRRRAHSHGRCLRQRRRQVDAPRVRGQGEERKGRRRERGRRREQRGSRRGRGRRREERRGRERRPRREQQPQRLGPRCPRPGRVSPQQRLRGVGGPGERGEHRAGCFQVEEAAREVWLEEEEQSRGGRRR